MSLLDSILLPIVETVKLEARHILSDIEENARGALARLTRTVRFVLAEFALWLVAAGLLFAGILVFLMRFFPVDAVLIGAALLLGYFALMLRLLR